MRNIHDEKNGFIFLVESIFWYCQQLNVLTIYKYIQPKIISDLRPLKRFLFAALARIENVIITKIKMWDYEYNVQYIHETQL